MKDYDKNNFSITTKCFICESLCCFNVTCESFIFNKYKPVNEKILIKKLIYNVNPKQSKEVLIKICKILNKTKRNMIFDNKKFNTN